MPMMREHEFDQRLNDLQQEYARYLDGATSYRDAALSELCLGAKLSGRDQLWIDRQLARARMQAANSE